MHPIDIIRQIEKLQNQIQESSIISSPNMQPMGVHNVTSSVENYVVNMDALYSKLNELKIQLQICVDQMNDAIKDMPKDIQEMYSLHYLSGASYNEVASAYHISKTEAYRLIQSVHKKSK